jgi:hypothetical protein
MVRMLSRIVSSGTCLPVTLALLRALCSTDSGFAVTCKMAIFIVGNRARRFLKYSRYQWALRSEPSTSTFLPWFREW